MGCIQGCWLVPGLFLLLGGCPSVVQLGALQGVKFLLLDGLSLLRHTSSLNFIYFPFSSKILQCLLSNS